MNIAHSERSERVFSSTGPSGLTSDNAKFFAVSFQTESAQRASYDSGSLTQTGEEKVVDFRRFAFKSVPVCGHDGLCLSGHLSEQDQVFEQVWAIYAEAFSGLARRTRQEQSRVMRHPRYRLSAIMQDDAVVGVLAWWELPGFCFVEHFAISTVQRSGGFGRRAMALLQEHVACPIVMDVDPFGTDFLAARRVAFYHRLGFHYCACPVTLPAYEGRAAAPSNLMAWPAALDAAGRTGVLGVIEREIYGRRVAMPYPSAV